MVELRHNHWTYPCVIIVWTIICLNHLWRIFIDCKCMTVSSIRLKWEMPYLPGLGGPNGILRSFLYKQVLYWIKNTTWAYFDYLLKTCTGMKKISLVYCFKIAAAADVRYTPIVFIPKYHWLYFLLTKKGTWTTDQILSVHITRRSNIPMGFGIMERSSC